MSLSLRNSWTTHSSGQISQIVVGDSLAEVQEVVFDVLSRRSMCKATTVLATTSGPHPPHPPLPLTFVFVFCFLPPSNDDQDHSFWFFTVYLPQVTPFSLQKIVIARSAKSYIEIGRVLLMRHGLKMCRWASNPFLLFLVLTVSWLRITTRRFYGCWRRGGGQMRGCLLICIS